MSEFTARKFANYNQAVLDRPRLTDFDVRLLWVFVNAADNKTGIARRKKQSELASMLGVTTRGIQRSRDRLVSLGYLVPIRQHGSTGTIVSYSVLGKATLRSPFNGDPDLESDPTVASDQGKATERSHEGDPTVAKKRPVIRTNLPSSSHFNPSLQNRDTGAGGPRQRAGAALGPPPLGKYDADLRRRLGENFQWLNTAKLVGKSGDTLTLEILTDYQGEAIRRFCGPDILAVAGVGQLEFKVALPTVADPQKKPRQP